MRAQLRFPLLLVVLMGAAACLLAEPAKQVPASGAGSREAGSSSSFATARDTERENKKVSPVTPVGVDEPSRDGEANKADGQSGSGLLGWPHILLLLVVASALGYWWWVSQNPNSKRRSRSTDPSQGQWEYAPEGTARSVDVSTAANVAEILRILKSQARTASDSIDRLNRELSDKNSSIAQLDEKRKLLELEKSKLESKVQRLDAEAGRIPELEESLGRAKQMVEDARLARERDRAEAEGRFAAFFPQSSDPVISQRILDLASAADKGDMSAKVSLAALSFIRSAESGQVGEEALLSVLRQFSESLVAHLNGIGRNPAQVAGALSEWAAELGPRFKGRLEIRVPSIGFPVDTRTMSSEDGTGKVTEVVSWCLFNSKGGIYAAARVN